MTLTAKFMNNNKMQTPNLERELSTSEQVKSVAPLIDQLILYRVVSKYNSRLG